MASLQISREKLIKFMAETDHFKYSMGAKPKTVKATRSDCSGYLSLLWQYMGFPAGFPAGSVNQRQWVKAGGFVACPYSDCAKMDNIVRVAYISPAKGRAGHTWAVVNGKTIECHSVHGACREPWTIYKGRASACFVVGVLV